MLKNRVEDFIWNLKVQPEPAESYPGVMKILDDYSMDTISIVHVCLIYAKQYIKNIYRCNKKWIMPFKIELFTKDL